MVAALAFTAVVAAIIGGFAVIATAIYYPAAFERVCDAIRDRWLGG